MNIRIWSPRSQKYMFKDFAWMPLQAIWVHQNHWSLLSPQIPRLSQFVSRQNFWAIFVPWWRLFGPKPVVRLSSCWFVAAVVDGVPRGGRGGGWRQPDRRVCTCPTAAPTPSSLRKFWMTIIGLIVRYFWSVRSRPGFRGFYDLLDDDRSLLSETVRGKIDRKPKDGLFTTTF